MPMQEEQSPLAGKLGARLAKAHKASKDKPVEVGNAGLPAGIENGVAQLVSCKIALYKEGKHKGKPYYMAQGIVIKPERFKGVKVAGRRTQVGPEPLCDTPDAGGKKKTFDDHYDYYLNELKKLNVTPPDSADPAEIEEGLLASMRQLEEDQPTFAFRTWGGGMQTIVQEGGKWVIKEENGTSRGSFGTEEMAKKAFPFAGREGRVNHDWLGAVDFSDNGHEPPAGAVQDDADASPPEPPEPDAEPEPDAPAEKEPAAANDPSAEAPDIDALVSVADDPAQAKTADGKAAKQELKRLALEAGIDEDAITNANDWAEIAAMIEAAASGSAAEADAPEPEPEPEPPVKGTVVKYRLRGKDGKAAIDPKTKKAVKAIEHEIASVSAKTETVTLMDGDTKKIIKGADGKPLNVPWADLE